MRANLGKHVQDGPNGHRCFFATHPCLQSRVSIDPAAVIHHPVDCQLIARRDDPNLTSLPDFGLSKHHVEFSG
jgi:hypothetical protein